MKIIYMSILGNTRRFVEKLGFPSLEITDQNAFTEVDEPFILIAPTYEIEATDVLNDFLETGNNVSYCRGILGGGNRNFNDLFCFTAYDLALDYNLEVLHCFEFQGSVSDLNKVKEIVADIENTNYIQST